MNMCPSLFQDFFDGRGKAFDMMNKEEPHGY
jgi:hypothetical protein